MTLQFRLWASAVLVSCAAAGPLAAQTWVEDSYDDFADGQNIYVARDGSVRTIHRFDLNQDGHIDLVFNSTHDRYAVIPATLATAAADGKVSHQPLAVEGSRQVAFADLNKDGYLDAVFCPNAGNVQDQRRFVTIIWGGDDGWPAHRANGALPVFGARSLALADLNADTWQDIVVLNGPAWQPGQPAGDIVRIYWGGEGGFQVALRQDLGVPRAIELAGGDFDGDRADDLAVLTSGGRVVMLWSSSVPSGAEISRTSVPLPAGGATCLAAADQNGDGLLDLIVGTGQGVVWIVHGAAGKSWAHSVQVRGGNASQISVGDLDGDARADLVLTDFSTARAGGRRTLHGGRDSRPLGRRQGFRNRRADANPRPIRQGDGHWRPERRRAARSGGGHAPRRQDDDHRFGHLVWRREAAIYAGPEPFEDDRRGACRDRPA